MLLGRQFRCYAVCRHLGLAEPLGPYERGNFQPAHNTGDVSVRIHIHDRQIERLFTLLQFRHIGHGFGPPVRSRLSGYKQALNDFRHDEVRKREGDGYSDSGGSNMCATPASVVARRCILSRHEFCSRHRCAAECGPYLRNPLLFDREQDTWPKSIIRGPLRPKRISRIPVLTCPKHRWTWDLKTGEPIHPQECGLAEYPVKVEGGVVYIDAEGIAPLFAPP